MVYDFPMDKYLAQLVLPRDMTEHEAARLAAFVKTLPSPSAALDEGEKNVD